MKLLSKTQTTSKIAPRSYKVEANGKAYRRNRKQLRSIKEPLQESTLEMDEDDHMSLNPPPAQLSQVEKQTATTPPRPQPPYASSTPEKSERTHQVPITSEIMDDMDVSLSLRRSLILIRTNKH